MFTLRPYQEEAVSKITAFFRSPVKHNALAVLPTGSGKSLVIAETVKRTGEPFLIFQPSLEILEQNMEKIRACGFSPTAWSASAGQKKMSDIVLATIGSARNDAERFSRFRNVIIDEAHGVNSKGGMYAGFAKAMPQAKFLGLTATPYRLTTDVFGGSILKFLTRTRPRVFDEMIYCCQCGDMAEGGYWSPLKYYQLRGFDERRVKRNSTGADYDDASLAAYYKEIGFAERLVDAASRLMAVGRRGVLVFTRFVMESEHVCAHVPGSVIVTGETPKKERRRIISAFRAGEIKMVCNSGVLTTGFDYPELDTVLLARPTMSLGLYYQMVGRAVRPHKDKREAWIVDICDNFDRFGRVEDLMIDTEGYGRWFVHSKGKKLTNVYLT